MGKAPFVNTTRTDPNTEALFEQFTTFRKRLHRGGGFAYYWTPDTGEYYTDKRTGKQAQSKWSLWFPADADVLPLPCYCCDIA